METDVILHGDASAMLRTLPDGCVQSCVTSPPYWNLRDYGVPGQVGLEATPNEYVARIVDVFREVWRVLAADGTLWLNLGDSYNAYNGNAGQGGPVGLTQSVQRPKLPKGHGLTAKGLKSKDLIGIPWMVAFALRAEGWYLRSDIVWAKSNPMPESVIDRPTRAHEYLFLLTKSGRYYYDAAAIREPAKESSIARISQPNFANQKGGAKDYANGVNASRSMRRTLEHWASGRAADKQRGHSRKHAGFNARWDALSKEEQQALGCNKRDVWTVATRPYSGAHFATFPPALIEPCILAGCPAGGIVLDPFMGAGTTAIVALKHSRHYLGVELNAEYIELAEKRIRRGVQRVLWSA